MSDNSCTNRVDKVQEWNAIARYVNEWYYNVDLEALQIILSVYVNHLHMSESTPIWLFLIGPASSGKTSIGCASIKKLPFVHHVSDINTTAWISGLPKNKGGRSLLFELDRMGRKPTCTQGVLLFEDFSAVLSMDFKVRNQLMSQMRQIYDGDYNPQKGTKTQGWTGKVSVVAAVTKAIEKMWGHHSDLGERFVRLRWKADLTATSALVAAKHFGNTKIKSTMQQMIAKFLDITNIDWNVAPIDPYRFANMAEMVCLLRAGVRREGKGNIIERPEPEAPHRVMQAMMQIATSHAAMFRRNEALQMDLDAGARIGMDSIPDSRMRVLSMLAVDGVNRRDMEKGSRLVYWDLERTLEDLIALGVMVESVTSNGTFYSLTNEFRRLQSHAMEDSTERFLRLVQFPEKNRG